MYSNNRRFLVSRRLGAAGSAILALIAVAACSSSSGSSGGGGGSNDAVISKWGGPGSDVPAKVLQKAPVAAASAIPGGSQMAAIRKRGYLIVGGATNNAAFGLLNPTNNKTQGFDVEIATMLAKYIVGKPAVKRVQETSETREPLLNNHTVDVMISTYTISTERAQQVTFAGPYFDSGSAILTTKSNNDIHQPSDLNGKTVCATKGSTNAIAVTDHAPKAKLLLLDSHAECLEAVQQNRAAGFANDEGSIIGDVAQHPDQYKLAITSYVKAPYGIGVAKGSTEFAKFIDHWITLIEKDGAWTAAYKDTLGNKIPGPVPTPPKIGSTPGTT